MKQILWLLLLTCLLASWTRAKEKERRLSFAQQLRLANVRYIRTKLEKPLSQLDKTNDFVSALTKEDLSSRIDKGSAREGKMLQAIKEVIAFQKSHNSRIAKWQKNSITKNAQAYYGVLEMSPKNVRRARRESYGDPWSYVSVHWAPHALAKGFTKDPMAEHGLELTADSWLYGDDDVKQYAFFTFLRKLAATKKENKLRSFLAEQVGLKLWQKANESFHFSRWKKKDYYVFRAHTKDLPVDDLPLAALIAARSMPPKEATLEVLPAFYERKLELFACAARELCRTLKFKDNSKHHFALYSFIASSFPFVTPFAPEWDEKGQWSFATAYKGDRPGSRSFAPGSPMALAFKVYEESKGEKRRAEKSLGPLFLLPMTYLTTSVQDVPHCDRRVGFAGFFHLYQSLIKEDGGGD